MAMYAFSMFNQWFLLDLSIAALYCSILSFTGIEQNRMIEAHALMQQIAGFAVTYVVADACSFKGVRPQ